MYRVLSTGLAAITVSVVIGFPAIACAAGASLEAGLVTYYPFNGDATDESGSGNHGTVHGAALTADRFGNPASAYDFDGANDYIGASADGLPTAARTVSLWFYADRVSNRPTALGYGGLGFPGRSWFQGLNVLGRQSFHMQSHWDNNQIDYHYPQAPILSWHHWAITTDTNGTRMYVDGELKASNSNFVDDTYVSGRDLVIGVCIAPSGIGPYTDGNVRFWDGALDEIRIYDRALSPAEIVLLAGTGACCTQNGAECAMSTEADCQAVGGTYLGDGTECPPVEAVTVIEPGGQVFVHVIGPPARCDGLGLRSASRDTRLCPPGGPFFDPWISPGDSSMCHFFGVQGSPPIPADFFWVGSEAFTGAVCLQGVSLGDPLYGDADTIIGRSDDPFDRCALPSTEPVSVAIEIFELRMTSVAPISVVVSGQSEDWNVDVDLSEVAPSPGLLTVTKTHCNGGTYTSVLNVQPRFTFTKVTDPTEVRVLDTGLFGIDPVTLNQTEPLEWVSDLGLFEQHVDPCSDFHAGFTTGSPVVNCDCNGNGVRDLCDIEAGMLDDCNGNAIPDSCEIATGTTGDCNGNGVPDACDIAAGVFQDCNANAVPDSCEIAGGAPDDNGNGIPDECEPTSVQDARAEDRLPGRPRLERAGRNPFLPPTSIAYSVPTRGRARLRVYDVSGQLVRSLVDGDVVAGSHSVQWDGRDGSGTPVASGIYFYRLEFGDFEETTRVTLLR